jgi:ribose transport system ATP-binding protein
LLQVNKIDKRFGLHYALSNISLEIKPGEIHALVGENGAGKSTLIKILTGVYQPDGGQIIWNNREIAISEPFVSRKLGIQVVHQDRQLIHHFTGYENLFLGMKYPQRKFGVGIRWKKIKKQAEAVQNSFGIHLDLHKLVEHMSPPEKTMLEIMRAAMMECQLLILDEPTAALSDEESELLFELIQKLVARGTAILYVSHRLHEIFRLSNRVTVMRNGTIAGTFQTDQMNEEKLVQLMTNQSNTVQKQHKLRNLSQKNTMLHVNQVSSRDQKVKNVSLNVKQGEIVGIFGLAGAGRTELLETIYGTRKLQAGSITLQGEKITSFSPKKSLSRGVVLIPEDRRGAGLVLNMSIRENMTLSTLRKYASFLKIHHHQEQSQVSAWMNKLQVKAVNADQPTKELSGGNQQKVVFAKALLCEPVLFLCDEPTQAVDVMTREEIHHLLKEEADKDSAVLFVSSDVQEIIDISDRIYVMHEGVSIAELTNDAVTAEQILQICYNQRKQSDG